MVLITYTAGQKWLFATVGDDEYRCRVVRAGQDVAKDDSDLSIKGKRSHQFLYPVCGNFAIIISNGNELGSCIGKPKIATVRHSLCRASDIAQAGIDQKLSQTGSCHVVFTLVDNDYFKVGIVIEKDRRDRRRDCGPAIARRNDDRDW